MNKEKLAKAEYERLKKAFLEAGATDLILEINDSWIKKTAELYADLENLKSFQNLVWKSKDITTAKETAASKMKIKYMAQYNSAMLKLNKILVPTNTTSPEDDEDLGVYSDD